MFTSGLYSLTSKMLSQKKGATWYFLIVVEILVQLSVASQNGVQFFGHEIILRPAFMSRDGQHSFVDTNVTLTRGTLKAFRFFIHNLADDTVMSDVTAQIWRPIIDEDAAFRLVWEKKFTLDQKNLNFVATLEEEEEFEVKRTDKIGFQCDSNTCPITMDIDPVGRTYIRQAQRNVLGKVMYDFKGPIATVFSIGVDILPSSSPRMADPALSDISMAEDELLNSNNDQSSVPDDWDRQTSGITEEELEVSPEDEVDENMIETYHEDEAFEEPEYTPEQREEMMGRSVYYGHNLSLEEEFWSKGGRKTFIDTSFKLQNGILKAISLFVHNTSMEVEDVELYLELWRRYAAETTNFQLVWQKKVKLTKGTNRLYEFILNPSDQVPVTDKHRLGFSNLHNSCPITFKYSEEGRTLFKIIKRYESPSFVDDVYHFAEIHEPIQYSMGAHVAPDYEPVQDIAQNDVPDESTVIRIGHELQKRKYLLPNTPISRAFVDRNVHLTPGNVTKFIAYIGGLPARELSPPIRFQIWTYNGTSGEGAETHPVYKLKWQQTFTLSSLTLTTRGRREEEFVVTDPVQVDSNDRIGFVSEAKTVQIPYDFNNPLGQSAPRDLVDVLPLNTTDGHTLYPEVGEEIYHFDTHPHPITWSLLVEIQPKEEKR